MVFFYLIDDAGQLTGPVEIPVVPGLGIQMPSNAVQLPTALPDPLNGSVWALVNDKPQQLPDNRGLLYHIETGEELLHRQLGDVPEGYTTQPRPSPAYRWEAGEWALDPQYLYSQAETGINAACEAAIVSGFWSSALGGPYQYSSQLEDQLNLTGVILANMDTLYGCRDASGAKDLRLHSVVQIRQVGDDFTAIKLQLLQKANILKRQLDQALVAGDCTAIQSVIWTDADL